MARGEQLKRALAAHYTAKGLPCPSTDELGASAAALTRFFELLAEADRKRASQTHATPHLRNPDRPDPA